MPTRVLSVDRKYFSVTVLLLVFVSAWSVAGDEAKSPSEGEKKAVAALVKKGAVIFIDGDYQVTQILGGRDLTNQEIKHVAVFKNLKSLTLSTSKINDEAVDTLKTLSQLQTLNLPTGAMSDQSIQVLKNALPKCRIVLSGERGFGTTGIVGNSRPNPSTAASNPPGSWRAFEFPPIVPAPSVIEEIRLSAVQERMNLTSEQKKEIEKVTGRDFQRQQTEEAIKKVLTSEQKTILKQVLLQREGPTALVLPEVAQELKLTGEQRESIQKVMEDRRRQLMLIGDQLRDRTIDFAKSLQETNRVHSDANSRLLAVLSEQQRREWELKIGPPLPKNERFSGFSSSQTPEEIARSTFRNLDRNNDGQLTQEEWQRSRNTRTKFENAKIEMAFPIQVEEFVKRYLKLGATGAQPNP